MLTFLFELKNFNFQLCSCYTPIVLRRKKIIGVPQLIFHRNNIQVFNTVNVG